MCERIRLDFADRMGREHDEVVSQGSPARSRPGRPPATSRAQILAAARQLIDREGWEKLTLRRLAAELGIGTATLYRNVRDRDDLLIQLLNDYSDQTLTAELPSQPRDRIIAAAKTMHDSLSGWPWAAEVLTVDGFIRRLGASSLRMVEAILSGAIECGCTREQAVELFRNLWYFTTGEILVRSRSRRPAGQDERPAPPRPFFDEVDLSPFPQLAAVGNDWPVLSARDTYLTSLEAFVDGLLARSTSR